MYLIFFHLVNIIDYINFFLMNRKIHFLLIYKTEESILFYIIIVAAPDQRR
jgi:hypothetical protein